MATGAQQTVLALAGAALGLSCLCSGPEAEGSRLRGVLCGEDEQGRPCKLSAPEIERMRDSSELLRAGDFDGLRATLERDGYLLLRGLLDRGQVSAARQACTDFLEQEQMLRKGADVDDAVVKDGGSGVLLAKWQDTLVADPAIQTVLESPQPFFDALFVSPPLPLLLPLRPPSRHGPH